MAVSANSAGYCTEEIFGTEVWNVAGANQSSFGITGRTFFREADGEACATIRADVPWLSVTPTAGDVAADRSTAVTVSVDATGLDDGEYMATLIVTTTDPFASELLVPVTLTVAGEPEPKPAPGWRSRPTGRSAGCGSPGPTSPRSTPTAASGCSSTGPTPDCPAVPTSTRWPSTATACCCRSAAR